MHYSSPLAWGSFASGATVVPDSVRPGEKRSCRRVCATPRAAFLAAMAEISWETVQGKRQRFDLFDCLAPLAIVIATQDYGDINSQH